MNPTRQLFLLGMALLIPIISKAQSYNQIRTEVNKYPVFVSLEEALLSHQEVYRLDLSKSEFDFSLLSTHLQKFVNLRELILSNSFIAEIPSAIGSLKNLQFLDIQHLDEPNTSLNRLPSSISKLKKLVSINLIGNPSLDWKKTFKQLSKLPLLENLAIMNNNFKKLPYELSRLQHLKMIWLGKNSNMDLKDALITLGKLDSLQQMGLGGNLYTHMPDEIKYLDQIENLWLSGNKWESLNGIEHLPKLSQLSLHNCQLSSLPEAIKACKNIGYLSLVENPGMDFERVLNQLPSSVETLNLNKNAIKSLPAQVFQNKNLKRIILRGNPISESNLESIKKQNPELMVIH